jgi:hypothetical protein
MGKPYRTYRQKAYRKAVANTRDLSVRAILTYPCLDLAGDYVHPDGLDFREHQLDPWNDLEHNGRLVGWARKSLGLPGSDYGVTYTALDIDGVKWKLPVGTTWFDPNDRVSAQVFALCERDALPGVSLEFSPVPKAMKALGKSPLENRNAYEFERVNVIRWTHCAQPVNQGAQTVTKSMTVADPLASILSANRIGSEQLDPVIRKALSAYIPSPNRSTVRVEKAMDEFEDEATVYDDAMGEEAVVDDEMAMEPDGDEAPALGGVAGLYAFAQSVMDALSKNEADMMTSDALELRKFAEKLRGKVAALAEEIKGMADKHDAKLNGGSQSEETEGEEVETVDDDEPADMDVDDDGVLKALRPVYYKALRLARLKRFTKAEIDGSQADDESELKAARAELELERRKLRLAQARYGS